MIIEYSYIVAHQRIPELSLSAACVDENSRFSLRGEFISECESLCPLMFRAR
jgi:hypothetical protein